MRCPFSRRAGALLGTYEAVSEIGLDIDPEVHLRTFWLLSHRFRDSGLLSARPCPHRARGSLSNAHIAKPVWRFRADLSILLRFPFIFTIQAWKAAVKFGAHKRGSPFPAQVRVKRTKEYKLKAPRNVMHIGEMTPQTMLKTMTAFSTNNPAVFNK